MTWSCPLALRWAFVGGCLVSGATAQEIRGLWVDVFLPGLQNPAFWRIVRE